jgi:hypothetical protein
VGEQKRRASFLMYISFFLFLFLFIFTSIQTHGHTDSREGNHLRQAFGDPRAALRVCVRVVIYNTRK